MGCGTSKLTLEEMGLVGQHAYSLVGLREFEAEGGRSDQLRTITCRTELNRLEISADVS